MYPVINKSMPNKQDNWQFKIIQQLRTDSSQVQEMHIIWAEMECKEYKNYQHNTMPKK